MTSAVDSSVSSDPEVEPTVERGVVPCFYTDLAPGFTITTPIRQTPYGRLDLLDVCENVSTSRGTAKHALKAVLNRDDLGIAPGVVTRVRWKGARGPYDSQVAMPRDTIKVVLSLSGFAGAAARTSIAMARFADLEKGIVNSTERIRSLEAETARSTLDVDAQVQMAEQRLKRVQEAERVAEDDMP